MGKGTQMNMAGGSDRKKIKPFCVYRLNNMLLQRMDNYDFRSN